jgi:4-hydroxy-2-oxoheptanedioate aldolase
LSQQDYFNLAEPWPAQSPRRASAWCKDRKPAGVAKADEILAVPGLGFAELGPGDLGLALGYTTLQRRPYPPEMEAARTKVFAALPQKQARLSRGRHAGQDRRQPG